MDEIPTLYVIRTTRPDTEMIAIKPSKAIKLDEVPLAKAEEHQENSLYL